MTKDQINTLADIAERRVLNAADIAINPQGETDVVRAGFRREAADWAIIATTLRRLGK